MSRKDFFWLEAELADFYYNITLTDWLETQNAGAREVRNNAERGTRAAFEPNRTDGKLEYFAKFATAR